MQYKLRNINAIVAKKIQNETSYKDAKAFQLEIENERIKSYNY